MENTLFSNRTGSQDNVQDSNFHLIVIVTLVLAVISCMVTIGVACIICLHREKNPKPDKQQLPGNVPPELTVTPSQVSEKPQFLFIYVSDNQSFKKIVLFLQRMIESNQIGIVTDPYKERDNICRDDPLAWLHTRISLSNIKVILFMNEKITSRYVLRTSPIPDDPLSHLLNAFFSKWLGYLRSEQVIHVCMENFCIPQKYRMPRLYALPSHFKKLMLDLEMCIDDDTLATETEKLQIHCGKYAADLTSLP